MQQKCEKMGVLEGGTFWRLLFLQSKWLVNCFCTLAYDQMWENVGLGKCEISVAWILTECSCWVPLQAAWSSFAISSSLVWVLKFWILRFGFVVPFMGYMRRLDQIYLSMKIGLHTLTLFCFVKEEILWTYEEDLCNTQQKNNPPRTLFPLPTFDCKEKPLAACLCPLQNPEIANKLLCNPRIV
jgi:hypothetical protein